ILLYTASGALHRLPLPTPEAGVEVGIRLISFFYLFLVWFSRIIFHVPERSIDSSRFYCFMSSFRLLPNFYVLRFLFTSSAALEARALRGGYCYIHAGSGVSEGFYPPSGDSEYWNLLMFLFLPNPFQNMTLDSDIVSPILTDRRYIYTVHFRVVRRLYIPTFRFPFYHDSSRTFHSDTSFPIHLRLWDFTLRLRFHTILHDLYSSELKSTCHPLGLPVSILARQLLSFPLGLSSGLSDPHNPNITLRGPAHAVAAWDRLAHLEIGLEAATRVVKVLVLHVDTELLIYYTEVAVSSITGVTRNSIDHSEMIEAYMRPDTTVHISGSPDSTLPLANPRCSLKAENLT
ncbi:hypothetical protein PM082_010713, partial [Marasmius tenuissimus]